MKDKNFLFTISLTLCLLILTIISCFQKSEAFDQISQSIGFPLLLFAFSSFSFSVREGVVKKACSIVNIEREKIKTLITQQGHYEILQKVLQENINGESLGSNNSDNIKEIEQTIQEIEQESETITNKIACYELIRDKTKIVVIDLFYVVSLCLLLLALILPNWFSVIFSFMNAPTLSLISFLFPILEIVIKEPLVEKITNHKAIFYMNKIGQIRK